MVLISIKLAEGPQYLMRINHRRNVLTYLSVTSIPTFRRIQMTDVLEHDLANLRKELADLREDCASIVRTLQDMAKHGKAEAFSRAQDAHGDLADNVKVFAGNTARQIEEKPIQSALASFGIGLFLGMLLNGRRR
jgi:ElaB/YqjD/DUF883 family membrane-anchored ribosome-binding protein